MFPLNSIFFNIVSTTKLNKVAERGSPCLTPHSTINSSVKSLFILTRAIVCVKVRAVNLISLSGTSNYFKNSMSLFL
jgi:hypothetical protein